ncbi:MAG: hypothetical protein JKY65_29355 [Planctomycetes bacterium]|nr:hypothetical protein [Planctomycetota bacterium]
MSKKVRVLLVASAVLLLCGLCLLTLRWQSRERLTKVSRSTYDIFLLQSIKRTEAAQDLFRSSEGTWAASIALLESRTSVYLGGGDMHGHRFSIAVVSSGWAIEIEPTIPLDKGAFYYRAPDGRIFRHETERVTTDGFPEGTEELPR